MFSKIIRRSHMYLALFLVPWVLMYALSTIVMNHRHFFQEWYNHEPVEWTLEREIPYTATFSTDAKRWMVAEQILSDLNMEGSHGARGGLDNQITITRNNTVTPQRIIYNPKTQTLRIENQAFRTNAFLERMHRRRGYNQKYLTDDLWAITVDLFILATVLWVVSGLWMWWELKVTRKWGAVSIASGIALFTFFLFTI
ncbi:MAG: hypothetical protein ACI8V2_002756 [Candidatus Latescibacterota bacterium]|jgi:hypothetical protein